MTIQYVSDLHLEFPKNRHVITRNPIQPAGEILLLAGDIVPFSMMDEHADFFNYVSDHFHTTYWVPGNHEYYYEDIAVRSSSCRESVRSNVFLVNNITVAHDDIRFIFSTLWSAVSIANQVQIERMLSDFHRIRFHGARFSAAHYNQLHEECLAFIKEALSLQNPGKSVVVTHHVPTFLYYPEKYKGDIMNEAFATELFDLIEADGPDFWIYGHHHTNTPDFMIGKTGIRTNQLGYVKYKEHFSFSRSKILVL